MMIYTAIINHFQISLTMDIAFEFFRVIIEIIIRESEILDFIYAVHKEMRLT